MNNQMRLADKEYLRDGDDLKAVTDEYAQLRRSDLPGCNRGLPQRG